MMTWKTLVAALALVAIAGPALADAIDGDWCFMKDGRRFSIRSAAIVTPGGKTVQGDYGRHAFSYVVPAPEPGIGKTVFMTLMDENTVRRRVGVEGDMETWLRCSPSVSEVRPLRGAG